MGEAGQKHQLDPSKTAKTKQLAKYNFCIDFKAQPFPQLSDREVRSTWGCPSYSAVHYNISASTIHVGILANNVMEHEFIGEGEKVVCLNSAIALVSSSSSSDFQLVPP